MPDVERKGILTVDAKDSEPGAVVAKPGAIAAEPGASAAGAASPAARFTKAQLIGSERFRHRRDALQAVLLDREAYTIEAAEQILDAFMKGKVK